MSLGSKSQDRYKRSSTRDRKEYSGMTQRPWHLGWALKNEVGADDTPDRWSSGLCLNIIPGMGNSLPWMAVRSISEQIELLENIPSSVLLLTLNPRFRSLSHTGFQSPRAPCRLPWFRHSLYRGAKSDRKRPGSRLRSQETERQHLGQHPGPLTPYKMFLGEKHSDTLALFSPGL